MNANKHATGKNWVDPDDAPELTDDFFDRADEYKGGRTGQTRSPEIRRDQGAHHHSPVAGCAQLVPRNRQWLANTRRRRVA